MQSKEICFLDKPKNDIRTGRTLDDDNYIKSDTYRDRSIHNDTSSNIYISKDRDSDAKSDVEHVRVHYKQKIISFTMSNAIAVPIAKEVSITMTRTMLKAKVIVMTMTKSNNIMTELSISIVIAVTSSSDLLLKMFKKNEQRQRWQW